MVVIQISILKKEKDLMIFKQHTPRKEILENFGNRKIFELYNGETISVVKGKITKFKFSKVKF